MGLIIYKSKKEHVQKTYTKDLLYKFWETFYNYDDNSLYFESKEDLKIELENTQFTQEEQVYILKWFDDEDLYGYDVEVC